MDSIQSVLSRLHYQVPEPRWPFYAAAAATTFYGLRTYFAGGVCKETADLSGKTIFITGATTGLGVPTMQTLAKMGHPRVIIAARDLKKASAVIEETVKMTGNPNIEAVYLDLADLDSVASCVNNLKQSNPKLSIDILILNAGLALMHRVETKQGHEMMIGCNHLGHAYLVHHLLPAMATRSARIVVVGSEAHHSGKLDFDDMNSIKNFKHFWTYSNAKLCNLHFSRYLAKYLKQQGRDITVNCLHPGFVVSGLAREGGVVIEAMYRFIGALVGKTPLQGAQTSIYAAISRELEGKSGLYLVDCKIRQDKVGKHVTEENDVKLWDWTLKTLGIAQFGVPT